MVMISGTPDYFHPSRVTIRSRRNSIMFPFFSRSKSKYENEFTGYQVIAYPPQEPDDGSRNCRTAVYVTDGNGKLYYIIVM